MTILDLQRRRNAAIARAFKLQAQRRDASLAFEDAQAADAALDLLRADSADQQMDGAAE